MSVPCPRCRKASVVVQEADWLTEQGPRRSVWVDEPLRCPRGCSLAGQTLERLLRLVYARGAWQLPLFDEAAG